MKKKKTLKKQVPKKRKRKRKKTPILEFAIKKNGVNIVSLKLSPLNSITLAALGLLINFWPF